MPEPIAELDPRNLFTSRSPRDDKDIATCIQMLQDSPFWDDYYRKKETGTLQFKKVVEAWEIILKKSQGYIDIIENKYYADKVLIQEPKRPVRHTSYEHKFHSVWFVAYISEWFLQEIIENENIPDISMHFIQQLVAHYQDPTGVRSPVPTQKEILQGSNQEPGHHLYNFSFAIWHPSIALSDTRAVRDSVAYIRRIWESSNRFHGGISHHGWINNVAGKVFRDGFLASGHHEYREYAGNDSKVDDDKKYFLCLTKDQSISKRLHIPPSKDCVVRPGSNYAHYFDNARLPIANLTKRQQEVAYLIALGCEAPEIHEMTGLSVESVNGHQRAACRRLFNVLRYRTYFPPIEEGQEPPYNRGALQNCVLENMFEVRSKIIVPLYPWKAACIQR